MNQAEYERLEREFIDIRDERGVHANTAVRIGTAFLDLLRASLNGEFDEISFNKVLNKPTFLQGLITLGSIIFGEYTEGLHGGIITEEGVAELKDLWVREHAKLGDGTKYYDEAGRVIPALEVKGDSTFTGNLSSPEFVSAFFGGLGWAIQKKEVVNPAGVVEYKYHLEIDDVTIRNTLRVFEMIICQLLGENANRYFSDQMEVDHYDPETKRILLKTGNGRLYNPFRVGDLVEIQQFNGLPSIENDYYVTKHYEMRITAVGLGNLDDGVDRLDWVEFDRFVTTMENGTPDKLIKEFDTIVRADSDRNKNRKGLVTIMAVGENTPYMDILYGLKTDPKHAVKGRLGNLEGIRTDLFGWLEGFGAYINNLYGVGKFFNHQTGESLEASVRITRELFKSLYRETTYNIEDEDNFITNGFFQDDLNGWNKCLADGSAAPVESESQMLGVNEGSGIVPLLVNGSTMAIQNKISAGIEDKDGIKVLHLYGMGVSQDFSLIKENGTHEEMKTSDPECIETKSVADSLYMGVRILPVTAGRLSVRFIRSAGGYTGWQKDIDDSIDWMLVQAKDNTDDPWMFSGSGKLVVSYTGECYIRFVALTTDAVANSKIEYSTLYDQNSRHITLQARKQTADLNEAVADFTIKYNQITQTVADNWSAFQNAKTALEAEVSRIDGNIADYNSRNDGKWASFATWQSQTNTSIASFATALTVDGEIMAMSAVVQTFRQISQTVTDNWNAFQSTKQNLEGEIERIDSDIDDYNTRNNGKWNSFSTWQSQTDRSIASFATALSVDGQIMSMSSIVQTCQNISNTVAANYNSLDQRIGTLSTTADRISGRVSTVEGWGSVISSHSSSINSLNSEVGTLESGLQSANGSIGSLNSRVGAIEAWDSEVSMWVQNVNSTMDALQNPDEWEVGGINESAGQSFEYCKSNNTATIRYYRLVPISVATAAMLKSGYRMYISFFDKDKKCLSGTNWTGWKTPDSYGRVTFNNIPSNAIYGAVVLGAVSGSLSKSSIGATGFFLSNDNVVSEAYMKVFIDNWGTSNAKIKADKITFEYGVDWSIYHNSELMFRLSGDGDIYLKGKIMSTQQYYSSLDVNDYLYKNTGDDFGSYTINPSSDPYTLYTGSGNTSEDLTLNLPAAINWNGLLLHFFTRPSTRTAVGMIIKGSIVDQEGNSLNQVQTNKGMVMTMIAINYNWYIISQ